MVKCAADSKVKKHWLGIYSLVKSSSTPIA